MMNTRNLEAPDITRALRTGYGTIQIEAAEKRCCVCKEPILADTLYAMSEDGPICRRCEDRLDELFHDMSFIQKAQALNMDLLYNA